MDYGLSRDRSQFSVTYFGSVHLWGLDVIRDEGIGYRRGTRKQAHVRADPSDNFLISLPHSAQVEFIQAGLRTRFQAGSFSFLSTAKPFSAAITAEHGRATFAHTIVRVPGPLLRQRVPRIDALCGVPIELRPGAGRLMASLFDLALAEGADLSDRQAGHFSAALLDAIADAALDAPEFASLRLNAPCSAKHRLRLQAEHFILATLSDPKLDAAAIADHCKVSARYLRAAFAERGQTIGGFIRDARLRQCQAALRGDGPPEASIIEIAMTWGFNDAAYFSRAYRNRFGLAPSDERRRARQGLDVMR